MFEQRVEEGDGRSGLPAGEQRDGEGPAIRDRDGDPVAGLHALCRERARQGLGTTVELGERERALGPDERGPVRGAAGARLEEPDEVPSHRRYARKSLRLIRCQTSGGTRWRGVKAASEGLAVASTPHFAV